MYIDAEKLKAEIKVIQQSLEHRDVKFNHVKKIRTECSIEFCKCILDIIDSLQQEQLEVDLEKEFSLWWLKESDHDYQVDILYERYPMVSKKLAHHFYKLGLAYDDKIKIAIRKMD